MKENPMRDSAPRVQRELDAAYARAGAAFKKKDPAALMEMVGPGFIQVMPDGQQINREEAEAVMKVWFATTDDVTQHEVRINELRLKADDAVAMVAERVTTTFSDPQGRVHERAQANTACVTWRRTSDGWQIRRSEYLTGAMTVDGKPVDMASTRSA